MASNSRFLATLGMTVTFIGEICSIEAVFYFHVVLRRDVADVESDGECGGGVGDGGDFGGVVCGAGSDLELG